MSSKAITRYRAYWDEFRRLSEAHSAAEKAIADAITYGSPHSVYGMRRCTRDGEELEQMALAREVAVIRADNWSDDWVWGREYWMTRRSHAGCPLIAWTVDKNGRIIRGWKRHMTRGESTAYDTPGNRSCPGEAAWMPSVAPGLLSFPAYPFVRALDGDPDPRIAETINNLNALRGA